MSENAGKRSAASGLGDRFEVGEWLVDVRALQITNGGETRHLESKVMELLVCLAGRPGEVLTREELEAQVWRDVVVGYDSLTKAIIKLRRAFDDDSRHPQVIETVPKAGYRLIAEVKADPLGAHQRDKPVPVHATAGEEKATALDRPGMSRVPMRTRRTWAITAAAVVLLVIAGGLMGWQPWGPDVAPARPGKMAFPLPGKPSIAVLAFENLSGNPKQGYLSDAMAENIITELSRFASLFVIARNSSFAFKDKPADIRQVAEELGVRYVLGGSLQREEGRLRVSVHLIDALAGTYVWGEHYDRHVEDIFAIQDEIANTVAATVAHTVEERERVRATRKHPASLAAYEYYWRGDKAWSEWTKESNLRALSLFEKAIELDPNLARGYAGLANVYLNGYRWGYLDLPREESLKRALAAARKAVKLDPRDHFTHQRLAHIHMRRKALDEADAGFQKALQINPNSEHVLVDIAELRQYQGRYQESIDLMKEAMRRNPRHPDWYHWVLADTRSLMGRYEEALESMNRMASMPNERAYRSLAAIYVGLGRMDEAREAVKQYLERDPGFNVTKYREYLETLPYQDEGARQHYIDKLRKAGLPE